MILARERSDYLEQPLHVRRSSGTQKVMRFKNRTKVLYAGIFLVAFLLGLGLTWRYVQVTATGYEIVRMKKELKAVADQNQELQMRIENLQSLQRIETVAVTKLGMIKPDAQAGVEFVAIEADKGSTTLPGMPANNAAPAQVGKNEDSANIIRAFTNLVSAWTGKVSAAEAKTIK